MRGHRLAGRRVLLVEDEFLQAMDAKRWLEGAGAEVVGPTGFAGDVPALLHARPVDAAVVDINLGDGASYFVAGTLQDHGVPFLFLTGYECVSIPEAFVAVPCLSKPSTEAQVVAAVAGLLG